MAVSGGGKESKRARKKIRPKKSHERRDFSSPEFFSCPFGLFPAPPPPPNCPWVFEDGSGLNWNSRGANNLNVPRYFTFLSCLITSPVFLAGRTLLYGPLKFKVDSVVKLFCDLSPTILNFYSK